MINRLQCIQYLSLRLKIFISVFIIFFVTSLHVSSPVIIEEIDFLSIDKIAHSITFYFVGLWFVFITKKSQLIGLFIILCGYAFSMELLQASLGYRNFEWLDWVADILGILLSFFHLSKKL